MSKDKKSSEIARFADVAMWEAEPSTDGIESVGAPKATLLYMNPDPLGSIAMANYMYIGHAVRDISEITDEDRTHVLRDIPLTKLRTAFEFVDLHILLENVDRGFTHQLVRQRTAAYVMESMRFAVKTNAALEVSLPPSLQGTKDDDPLRVLWDDLVHRVGDGYNSLINGGMPAEDARGILPTNITTRVHWKSNLRNILDVAGVRLCTQAQFEWRAAWTSIMGEFHSRSTNVLSEADGYHKVYRLDDLANLFRPICWQTGRCEFMASSDRFCSIRDRVEMNHDHGIPPTEWEADHHVEDVYGPVFIGGIHPAEWLMDSAAARIKPGSERDQGAQSESPR